MFLTTLTEMLERDLLKLRTEISLYPDEQSLWVVRGQISNSAGNLCLHLLGNLRHFIGTVLGATGYVRDRDAEFALRHVPRQQLLDDLDTTLQVIRSTLEKRSDEDLRRDYPVEKHGQIVGMDHMLLHLLTHLNYHLGQVNYHRRLVA